MAAKRGRPRLPTAIALRRQVWTAVTEGTLKALRQRARAEDISLYAVVRRLILEGLARSEPTP